MKEEEESKMKKRTLIVLVVCICLLASGAFAYSKLRPVEGENEFRSIGENLRSPVKTLLDDEASLGDYPMVLTGEYNEESTMGEVLGVGISKAYFDVRYTSYKSSPLDYENPRDEAWTSIKKEVWERKFAEENNLMPTGNEIAAYVKTNKEGFDATDEGKALIRAFCEGMGLTESEYWDYNEKYEAPLAVIHDRVEEFAKENKIEFPDADEIDAKIIDEEYFEQL